MVGNVLSNSRSIVGARMAMGSSPVSAASALLALGILLLPSLRAQENPRPSAAPETAAVGSPVREQAPPAAAGESARRAESAAPVVFAAPSFGSSARRFQFKIDPNTPVKELLPVPSRITKPTGPASIKDMTQVPEVEFQAPLARSLSSEETNKQTAHTIAKINYLNDKHPDGFLETLCRERRDLDGLPFAMGDACRTKGERSRQFALAVATVRAALPQRALTPCSQLPTDVVFRMDPALRARTRNATWKASSMSCS